MIHPSQQNPQNENDSHSQMHHKIDDLKIEAILTTYQADKGILPFTDDILQPGESKDFYLGFLSALDWAAQMAFTSMVEDPDQPLKVFSMANLYACSIWWTTFFCSSVS